jgi:amidase
MDDDLCFTPAVELARRLHARELSARELLAAFLDRIHRVNPALNAIVTLVEDQATRQAAEADETAARGVPLGPLHGLPIAVKDLADTAGIRTTYGSPLFADHVPDRDAPHVAALRSAGAVIIGKTNTPEFGAGSQTFNTVFGATRNPWNPRLTPGGSSGGAAAAVAAGLLPFADGSDLAASVRNPAAMCSLFGLRTTPGFIGSKDPEQDDVFDPLSVVGPIARSAEDAALLLSALRGRDPGLPLARPGASATGASAVVGQPLESVAGLRIAWSPSLGGLPVEPEVARVLGRALAALADADAIVTEAEPDLAPADEVFQVLRGVLMAGSDSTLLRPHRDQLKDTLIWNIEYGLALTGAQVAAALGRRSEIFGRMKTFMRDYDVLAAPTVQVLPFPVEREWVTEINGAPQETYIDWLRSCSRITVTAHPAISVPAGLSVDGLPVGLQLVGGYGTDERLLAIAATVGQTLMPSPARPAILGSGHFGDFGYFAHPSVRLVSMMLVAECAITPLTARDRGEYTRAGFRWMSAPRSGDGLGMAHSPVHVRFVGHNGTDVIPGPGEHVTGPSAWVEVRRNVDCLSIYCDVCGHT